MNGAKSGRGKKRDDPACVQIRIEGFSEFWVEPSAGRIGLPGVAVSEECLGGQQSG